MQEEFRGFSYSADFVWATPSAFYTLQNLLKTNRLQQSKAYVGVLVSH
jgi:hypothetical protein